MVTGAFQGLIKVTCSQEMVYEMHGMNMNMKMEYEYEYENGI